MSILSSLFGSKKRAKKPSSPTNTSQTQKARASSPTNRPSPARFLSIRRRSSPGTSGQVQRRNSADTSRKQKVGKEWELPTLEFAGEGKERGGGKSVLGLDDVGRIPSLSVEEISTLSQARLSVEESTKAWMLLGFILKSTDHPGCILERPLQEQLQQYHGLLSLLLLVLRPAEISTFPSIALYYPTPTSGDLSAVWSDRLLDLAKAVPARIPAAALRWTLRRLQSSSVASSVSLVSPAEYIRFVQAEHAASYPLHAYHSILSPRLDTDVNKLLHEMFDVWAALTAHSEDRSGLGGKIALVLGWWIVQSEMGENRTWEELYAAWKVAARRVEHLFLAWMRYQTTTHTLPGRLLALTEKYPYGSSDYSAQALPLPPPSSFNRRTLHLHLHCDRPLKDTTLDPHTLLQGALSATDDATAGLEMWGRIREAVDADDEGKGVAALLNDESASYLAHFGTGNLQKENVAPPRSSRQQSQFEGRVETIPLTRTASNAKLLDALADEVGQMAKSHKTITGTPPAPSISRPAIPESTSTWDDFTKSGFGEDRESNLSLALTPSPTFASSSSPARTTPTSKLNGTTTPSAARRKATFEPVAKFSIAKEEIIDTDDMFIHFAEEALMERSTRDVWPTFMIARLRNPLSSASSDDTVERLLITVIHRPPPAPPTPIAQSQDLAPPRSVSPSAESTFRFGSFGFKRSASRPGFKSTLFGSSRSVVKDDKGSDFIIEPNTIYKKAATRNSDSIGGVDEMGQKVLAAPAPASPSRQPDTRQVSQASPKPVPMVSTSPTTPHNPEMLITAIQPGSSPSPAPVLSPPEEQSPRPGGSSSTKATRSEELCGDTSPSDWTYGAEGGAHVVFPYTGPSGPYSGKLLRLRKISHHRGDPRPDTSIVWREQLLPRLLPTDRMVAGRDIVLQSDWLQDLLSSGENRRTEARKEEGSLLEQFQGRPRVTVMENLRLAGESPSGQRVLAVEIKPKWGFLPCAETIYPTEAASIKSTISRYVLHAHYRGLTTLNRGAYDPLDLYSGDRARIKRAITGLLGVWQESGGEANSFRVFVDGKVVYPDEADLIPGTETGETLAEVLDSIISPLLQQSQVLSILRDLQHQLDPTDISDVARRFTEDLPNVPLFDESIVTDITPQELSEFVDTYLSNRSAGSHHSAWKLRQRIIAYSLSAVFKDCSIIVRAVLSAKEDGGWVVSENSAVKVLDLDLKPLKMKHWAELDEKIWRNWMTTKGLPSDTTPAEVPSAPRDAETTAAVVPSRAEGTKTKPEATALPGLFPFPMVHTPALGSERAFPGGFPGMPDVPATPGAAMDLSDALNITPVGVSRKEEIAKDNDPGEGGIQAIHGPSPPAGGTEVSVGDAFRESRSADSIEGTIDGGSSQYSSAMSTPLVPGAFKFPEVPVMPVRQAEPEEEILSDFIESQQSNVVPPADGPVTRTIEALSASPHSGAAANNTDKFADSTAPSETKAAINDVRRADSTFIDADRRLCESPVESRFERSLAPSPSPVPPSEPDAVPITDKIILSSPTFGQIPMEALSPVVSPSSEGHTPLTLDRQSGVLTRHEPDRLQDPDAADLQPADFGAKDDGSTHPRVPSVERQTTTAPIALGLPV